jgi:hypothetical protein
LFALIELHQLFIPRRDIDRWRPTAPTDGTVDGFSDLGTMTCIATDGLRAFYILPDGRTWLGHVQCFHWDVPIITMVPYVDEQGRRRFFKSVKDKGAPSALYRTTPKVRELKQRKVKKSKRKESLESL